MNTNPAWQKTGSATAERNTPLEIRVVLKDDRKRFDALMGDLHYLGSAKPIGDFLRQAVVRNGEWVGLLAWGPACYALKDRDEWIGWHATQRAERLKLVIQNRRFLLMHERGAEPNLASKALAAALRALPEQWEQQFGYRALLAETFTDIERFHGTCYKANGWIEAGESQGFSRDALDFYVPHGHIKRLWLKPLVANAREMLCAQRLPASLAAGACSNAQGVLPFKDMQLRSLMEALQTVPDPRARNSRFRLGSVPGITAMSLLCGCRQVSEIHRFASRLTQAQRAKIGLPLKRGKGSFREIPGYHVFYQLLRTIEPAQMAAVLTQWLQQQAGKLPGALALDGKFIGDTVGVLTLADHETGAPEAMAHCSKKKAMEKTVSSNQPSG
jgi:hypothetical protein